MYLIRSVGGLLYLAGMLIMCWNVYQTIRGRLRVEKPMSQAAYDPALDRPLPTPALAAAE
jgi:cytochrome c oxidase cbb3-type subunit 1